MTEFHRLVAVQRCLHGGGGEVDLPYLGRGRDGAADLLLVGGRRNRGLRGQGVACRKRLSDRCGGGHLLLVILLPTEMPLEGSVEGMRYRAQGDPVLGAARTGEARLNRPEVKLKPVVELRFGAAIRPEESLLLHVALNEVYLFGGTSREAQVAQRLVVDRKQSAGC